MARLHSMRSELEQLRAEVEALRAAKASAAKPAEGEPPAGLDQQIRNLMAVAEDYLEDAEDSVAAHPLVAVAGALALGIVIGRLTAR